MVSVTCHRVAIICERFELLRNRRKHLRVTKSLFRGVLNGVFSSCADNVNSWMGLLIRQGERIENFVLVETAVVARRTWLRPRLHQYVHGLTKPLAGVTGIDGIDPVFHSSPERKRAFQPTARHDIEHR